MQNRMNWTFVIIFMLAVPMLAACGSKADDTVERIPPAVVESIEGSDLHRITLTEQAAARLGIQTVAAEVMESEGSSYTAVPDSAVIYDIHGVTWVFVQLETLTYMRVAVVIVSISDGYAFLESGPDPGTEVVSLGAAELYGADLGVGK